MKRMLLVVGIFLGCASPDVAPKATEHAITTRVDEPDELGEAEVKVISRDTIIWDARRRE